MVVHYPPQDPAGALKQSHYRGDLADGTQMENPEPEMKALDDSGSSK